MFWVAWRQNRAQAAGAVTTAAGIALYAVALVFAIRAAAADSGLAGCLAEGAACGPLAIDLLQRFDTPVGALTFVRFLPLLVGAFVGAPLVARELERGTHLLAWTQGVTRGRWLVTRVAVAAAGVAVSMAVLAPAVGWLHREYYGRVETGFTATSGQFDLHHLAPAALALATLGIGVAAGVLIRRTIPAMAVTLGLGFALQTLVGRLRVRVIEPVREVVPFGESAAGPDDVIVSTSYIDSAGERIAFTDIADVCPTGRSVLESLDQFTSCARDAGIQAVTWLQPADRYWMLQGVNAGLLLAAGLIAAAVAYWATIRRTR